MNTWSVSPSGYLVVNGEIPRVSAINNFRKRVMRWAHCAAAAGFALDVPWSWILGHIYAESVGEPQALSNDGGYGLMQITHPSLFEGVSPEDTRDDPNNPLDDVLDPSRNIALGTRFLRRLVVLVGNDIVRVASAYNAGLAEDGPHLSAVSPWGYRETPGHISRVIAGMNSAIDEMPRVTGCYTTEYVKQWQTDLGGLSIDGKFGLVTLAASRAKLV